VHVVTFPYPVVACLRAAHIDVGERGDDLVAEGMVNGMIGLESLFLFQVLSIGFVDDDACCASWMDRLWRRIFWWVEHHIVGEDKVVLGTDC
jgi:hypothetical protein